MIELRTLAAELPDAQLLGPGEVAVSAICSDSRQVTPGSLFVAVPGFKADGHDYLPDAVARGAVALAVQANRQEKWAPIIGQASLPALVLPDTRRGLAGLAAAFYGHPGRRLRVVGVTGTDGKTSVVHLLAHVLEAAGQRTGLISTVECQIGGQPLAQQFRHTTPEAPSLQATLAQMVEGGCRYAVIEATSHGLALHRLDGCHFDVAVLTNLGFDHLDFHGTKEGYLAAKARLFTMLDEAATKGVKKTAVLNVDDPSWQRVGSHCKARLFTYGIRGRADVQAGRIEGDGWGSRFRLVAGKANLPLRLGMPGVFNVYNALAATAVALSQGLPLEEIAQALASWPGTSGRMELIREGQPFTVVVDFAHAPEALRRVLEFLRSFARGRIIIAFGCIGERDKERRLPMGRVAAELADYTIITDDNPFGEEGEAIIEEIAAGLRDAGKREGHHFARIPDRREAIAHALAMAVDEDVVLLAGKGHESRVYVGDGWYECDDRKVARQVLRGLMGGSSTPV